MHVALYHPFPSTLRLDLGTGAVISATFGAFSVLVTLATLLVALYHLVYKHFLGSGIFRQLVSEGINVQRVSFISLPELYCV